MQKGYNLHFDCQECGHPIDFSVIELKENVRCGQCAKNYIFQDENLKRQIQKFENLCRTLVNSEEILSNTTVGIGVGEKQVEVPYRLLLTRLNSTLALTMGGKALKIQFRLEPRMDMQLEGEK